MVTRRGMAKRHGDEDTRRCDNDDGVTTMTACDDAKGHSERAQHNEGTQGHDDDSGHGTTTTAMATVCGCLLACGSTEHRKDDNCKSTTAHRLRPGTVALHENCAGLQDGPSLPAFTMGVGYYSIPCLGEDYTLILNLLIQFWTSLNFARSFRNFSFFFSFPFPFLT